MEQALKINELIVCQDFVFMFSCGNKSFNIESSYEDHTKLLLHFSNMLMSIERALLNSNVF